jgi:hypothetical protein
MGTDNDDDMPRADARVPADRSTRAAGTTGRNRVRPVSPGTGSGGYDPDRRDANATHSLTFRRQNIGGTASRCGLQLPAWHIAQRHCS